MSINETLLAATQMRSISMGGEIVDQTILDGLAGLYPAAKIRHIYASSEVGAAIVVTDGKSGFDAQLLGREGRVYFGGRAGNTMINVGGQKAFPWKSKRIY